MLETKEYGLGGWKPNLSVYILTWCVLGAYVLDVRISVLWIYTDKLQPVVLGRKSIFSVIVSHANALPNTF